MKYLITFIRSCTFLSILMRPLNPSMDVGEKRWLRVLNDVGLMIHGLNTFGLPIANLVCKFASIYHC